jgi:hypothetical protein
MITQVKWNKDKPKFKDVEGKLIVVKTNGIGEYLYPAYQIRSEGTYRHAFIDFIAYAILSDEPVYCEWRKNDIGEYQGSCTSLLIGYCDWWVMCPVCGNPIKVIEDEKPLPLMGIYPKIECSEGSDGHLWTYHWYSGEIIISSNAFDSKREAIVSWNEFVKRVSKE